MLRAQGPREIGSDQDVYSYAVGLPTVTEVHRAIDKAARIYQARFYLSSPTTASPQEQQVIIAPPAHESQELEELEILLTAAQDHPTPPCILLTQVEKMANHWEAVQEVLPLCPELQAGIEFLNNLCAQLKAHQPLRTADYDQFLIVQAALHESRADRQQALLQVEEAALAEAEKNPYFFRSDHCPIRAEEPLKCISWNVCLNSLQTGYNLENLDGILRIEYSKPMRTRLIASWLVLQAQALPAPDVIALQEASVSLKESLQGLLPSWWQVFYQSNGLLTCINTQTLAGSGQPETVYLPEDPAHADALRTLQLSFIHKESQQSITIANNHWEYAWDPTAVQKRLQASAQMAREKSRVIINLGDFNRFFATQMITSVTPPNFRAQAHCAGYQGCDASDAILYATLQGELKRTAYQVIPYANISAPHRLPLEKIYQQEIEMLRAYVVLQPEDIRPEQQEEIRILQQYFHPQGVLDASVKILPGANLKGELGIVLLFPEHGAFEPFLQTLPPAKIQLHQFFYGSHIALLGIPESEYADFNKIIATQLLSLSTTQTKI